MKVAELPAELREQIGRVRCDYFFEKHEGPWDWAGTFRYGSPEFLRLPDGREVLLPTPGENHKNLTVLRYHVSEDGTSITLFLKDTTYVTDPKLERFEAGRVVVCDRFPGHAFYVAILVHEWFITF
ncbi:MAG: hypothetical protein HY721_20335 [Planctomycetes bacterium]|nr:hypothetical protein [Planctomycetota bacterium]